MNWKDSIKNYIFTYNLVRGQKEQFGILSFFVILTVNALEIISVLALIHAQESDLFSSTLNQTIGLFALPNLVEVFGISTHNVLFALIALLGVYIVGNMVYIFTLKTEDQMRKYSWVMIPLPKGDLCYLYKKVMFVPIAQLALTEVLHMRSLEEHDHCSSEWCENTIFALGIVLLVMAIYLYGSFSFITIPCHFEDEAQEDALMLIAEIIKSFHITLVIALAVANINVFIVFAFWGSYWVIDMIVFLWNGRYTRPQLEYFSSILKGVEFAVFWMYLLPNVVDSPGSNYSFVGFIICPLAIKVIYNLKLSAERQIIIEFSSNLQGIQSLPLSRVHKCLKSLLYECNAKVTRKHESSSMKLGVLTSMNENSQEMVDIGPLDYKAHFAKGYLDYEGSQEQTVVDILEKIYSLMSYDTKNKINIEIILQWIIFLKDVKKSHIKAFTLLSQMQKGLQHTSLRRKLQVDVLDYLIRQQVSLKDTEKSISAEALFTFLGDVDKTKNAIETYLVKTFEFYILTQNQIVKAVDIKKQGSHLLSERVVILKKLKNLLNQNGSHRETKQLFNFFIKEIIEDSYEGKFWELNQKRNMQLTNDSQSQKEKDWNLNLETFANSIDGLPSSHHVIVLSLDPVNSGRVLKISNKLLEMLGLSGINSGSLQIDTLEATFFNRKNMKWIRDQIMDGKDPFEAFTQEDRVIYLKNSNGKFLAFHFYPCLEIYKGVPTIVCYIRTFIDYDHKFLIFNPGKENKIVGIGKGITWLDTHSLKGKRVQDFISSFPSDCQQLTKVLIEGASLEWKGLNHCKASTVTTEKTSALLDEASDYGSQTIDYVVEMPHTTIVKKRLGVLTIVSSWKKQTKKYAKDNSRLTSLFNQMGSQDIALPCKEKSLMAGESESRYPTPGLPTNRIKFEILGHLPTRSENQTADDDNEFKPFHPQAHNLEVTEGGKTGENQKVKKSPFSDTKHVKIDFARESSSDSEPPSSNQKNLNRIATRKLALESEKLKNKAPYAGSTTSTHRGSTNYLRALINGNRTPGAIKTVFAFGTIIFGITIGCIFVGYGILTTQYVKLSDFSAHATFPGFLKAISASVYMATEMQLAANLGQFSEAEAPNWIKSVEQIIVKRIPIFYETYGKNLLNFNPESLTDDLNLDNYTINFTPFPKAKIEGELDFYGTTAVFMTYAQRMSRVPTRPEEFSNALVEFMRFFTLPYASQMLDPIREILVESAYGQFNFVTNVLNYVTISSTMLIGGLSLIFGYIFRKFENAETLAFAKLCTVLPKENLVKEINKFITAYESRLGPSPNLSAFGKVNTNFAHEKGKNGHGGFSQSARKIIHGNLPAPKLLILLLSAAVILSGCFIMTTIYFNVKTQILHPFLEDLDKISAGIPSYSTVLSTLLRFMNEVKNPRINVTLPELWETYQPVITEALRTHDEMMPRFREFSSRIMDTDITSEETKIRYQNNTNENFCWSRDVDGSEEKVITLCLTGLKNVASRGMPDTADLVINTVIGLIQQFVNSPTKQTADSIFNATDIYFFNYLTNFITSSITNLANAEQIDISNYAGSIVQATYWMEIISLVYTCLTMVMVWIPTIVYLKRRFQNSRSIFLLFPIRLLRSSQQVKQLLKKW